jgi:hypothetical protein
VKGVSGGRYVVSVRTGAALFCNINPPTAGIYYVWFRGLTKSAASDTMAVNVNGATLTYQLGAGFYSAAWQWSILNKPGTTAAPVLRALDLPAGTQRLVLTTNEIDIQLDGVLITNDPTFIPNDSTPYVKIP